MWLIENGQYLFNVFLHSIFPEISFSRPLYPEKVIIYPGLYTLFIYIYMWTAQCFKSFQQNVHSTPTWFNLSYKNKKKKDFNKRGKSVYLICHLSPELQPLDTARAWPSQFLSYPSFFDYSLRPLVTNAGRSKLINPSIFPLCHILPILNSAHASSYANLSRE